MSACYTTHNVDLTSDFQQSAVSVHFLSSLLLPAEVRQGLLSHWPGQGEADCHPVIRQEDPVRRPDQHHAPRHHPHMARQEAVG